MGMGGCEGVGVGVGVTEEVSGRVEEVEERDDNEDDEEAVTVAECEELGKEEGLGEDFVRSGRELMGPTNLLYSLS